METKTLTIRWSELSYDARAHTWKAGNATPREDGLHGEAQMDDDGTDINLAKRSAIIGAQKLTEALKRYLTESTGAYTLSGVTASTTWTLSVNVSNRNNASDAELSALGHAYMLAQICADWYQTVDPGKAAGWQAQQRDAEARLINAINKKTAPTLTQ